MLPYINIALSTKILLCFRKVLKSDGYGFLEYNWSASTGQQLEKKFMRNINK